MKRHILIEQGMLEMETTKFCNMLQIVVDIFSDMLNEIRNKNVTIQVKVSHEKHIGLLSNIQFSKKCLYTILHNFIYNSLEMVEENGEVSLIIDLKKS